MSKCNEPAVIDVCRWHKHGHAQIGALSNCVRYLICLAALNVLLGFLSGTSGAEPVAVTTEDLVRRSSGTSGFSQFISQAVYCWDS